MLNLNTEQQKAAHSKKPNNLVIASAGTGKTSTIIGRVLYLLENGIKPEEILLLTFTAKAASEMLARLEKYTSKKVASKIFAGTFHSYGKKLLEKNGKKLKIVTQKETKTLLEAILSSPVLINISPPNPYTASTINDYIGLYENTKMKEPFSVWLIREFKKKLDQASEKEEQRLNQNIESIEYYQSIYDKFIVEKRNGCICDFNDMLKYIAVYFSQNKNHLKEIIVDEYQDTNSLQNKVIEFLSANGSNIFAVGDYDQSIYGFNGSNVAVIGEFPNKYLDVEVHNLFRNYRSSKQILEIANKCICRNKRILPKKLEAMKKGNFNDPELHVYETSSMQYKGVVDTIQSSPYNLNDIAVLFRGNASGDYVESLLVSNGIDYSRTKNSSMFDSFDISILISLYKALKGTSSTIIDFIQLRSFIKSSKQYELKNIYSKISSSTDIGRSFLREIQLNKKVAPQKNVRSFVGLAEKLLASSSPKSFFEIFYRSDEYALFFDMVVKNNSKYSKDSPEDIIDSIERKHKLFLDIASSCRSFKDFERKISGVKKKDTEEAGVKLLTVHASKGLEFKEVLVIDLVEGKFPNLKMIQDGWGSMEEERRLFYVAVTRAEEKLSLHVFKKDNSKKSLEIAKPSRFISEAGLL